MSNPAETEILAMEFDAVLSVPRRVGFSTLYKLARRESGATIAGPCQFEKASEGACRSAECRAAAKEKCSSTSLEGRAPRFKRGARLARPSSLKICNGTQPGSTIGGRHVLAETEILERCFHFTPVLFVSKA
jgi:hypothetical protein